MFALTAEQRRLLDDVLDLGRDVLAPLAARGPHGRVDRDLTRSLAARGVLPRLFPGEDGRVSALELCLIREALAQTCTQAEHAVSIQGLASYPILDEGSDELRRRWLPPLAAGTAVPAFALTEQGAGSDAGAVALRADRDGDGWRLSGEKLWISNAPDADVYVVFGRTTPGVGARGVTAFAVEGSAQGLSGEPLELLAPHPIGRLSFEGVFVPADAVLGDVDGGFRVAMRTLDRFRPSVGANAVGLAQSALDLALAHTADRRAFGGRLLDLQAVRHRLADMATRLEAARLLVYAAAAAFDRGERITRQAAMAKLHATEVAQEVVDAAVQLHGAAGLQRGHPLERLYREVRAPRIYEGASEVQRDIIARELYRDGRSGE